MQCAYCQTEFTPVRKAKFCSKKCAIYFKRKINEVNPNVPNLTVADIKEAVVEKKVEVIEEIKAVVLPEPEIVELDDDDECKINVHSYNMGKPIFKAAGKNKK